MSMGYPHHSNDMDNSIEAECSYTYNNYHQCISSAPKEKSIVPEINKYGYGEDINHKADSFYKIYGNILRKGPRLSMIAFCIYLAHLDLKIPIIPEIIAKRMGISKPADISKSGMLFFIRANSMIQYECNLVQKYSNYTATSSVANIHYIYYEITLFDIVNLIINNIPGLHCDREKILEFTRSLEDNHFETIKNTIHKKIQYIAAGIILYYIDIHMKNNKNIKDDLYQLIFLKSSTIESITKKIKEIDN